MKRRWFPAAFAAMVLLAPTSTLAAGTLHLLYGQKKLESDWEPLDTQDVIGLELTFGLERSVGIAIDYFYSEDDGTYGDSRIEAMTKELDAGVRCLFRRQKKVQPFIGGGLAFNHGSIKVDTTGLEDEALGLWLAGGVVFRVGRHFDLGLDLRGSTAKVKIAGVDLDAGGVYAGVLLGVRWGGD